jgi:hypothetical protein
MDLRQFASAVGAHRRVTAIGVAAAIALALLSYVRFSPFGSPMFEYRKPVLWGSKVTLQLTQEGFPEGRVQDRGSRRASLVALAPLYARLANTDPVRRKMRELGPIYGGVKVRPLVDDNNVSLPLIEISSFTFSNTRAPIRVRRQADAFIRFIAQEQRQNDVSPANRVVLAVVSGPSNPVVVVPRKLTLPVVVFLSMLIVTGAVILTLENRRRNEAGVEVTARPDGVPRSEFAGEAEHTYHQGAERPVTQVKAVGQMSRVSEDDPVTKPRAVALSRPIGTLGSGPAPDNGNPRQPDEPVAQEGASSGPAPGARQARAGRRRHR